jgi:hypothetical protein
MKTWNLTAMTAITVAVAAAFPGSALAQSNEELLKEIRALKERVTQLEAQQKTAAPAKPAAGQWGMTPEQAAEFARVATKTEGLEDSIEAMGLKNLKITGFADPTYIYNQRQNRGGFQFLNQVYAGDNPGGYNYDNSYFGGVTIDLLKETDNGTRWHLTLTPNRGAGSVIGDASIVQEASVSIPLSDLQTRLIAGQLPDWSGYEYQQATLNKLITHNLLFDLTLPTTYTGAGLELTRGKWLSKVMLANMNSSLRKSGDKSPVLTYRVDYSKGEFSGFGFAGLHGRAANWRSDDVNPITGDAYDTRDTKVNLFEADAYFIRGDWTVQGQLSYGTQKSAAITADPLTGEMRDSSWYGASALASYQITPRFGITGRLDHLRNRKNGGGLLGYSWADDRNGIGPDPLGDQERGTDRTALSVGLSYRFNLSTTFKAEYRLDRASLPVFLDVRTGEYHKTNNVFGTSVVVSF